jgi:hydroxymethylbilane synthase
MGRIRYRVGTGGSRLSLTQTRQVIDLLQSFDTESEFKIEIVSSGKEATHPQLALTAELERALIDKRVDIAVHAAKDLPVRGLPGVTIAAYMMRLDPRESLISQRNEVLNDLPPGSIVGTKTDLQRYQLSHLRGDLKFIQLEGPFDQQIRKVRHGEIRAVILSNAGLIRLGLTHEAAQIFPLELVMPVAGQGALALQCRHNDMRCVELLELVNHEPTAWAVLAERDVLKRLEDLGRLCIGICASFPQAKLLLQALVIDPVSGRRFKVESQEQPRQWDILAKTIAEELTKLVQQGPLPADRPI